MRKCAPQKTMCFDRNGTLGNGTLGMVPAMPKAAHEKPRLLLMKHASKHEPLPRTLSRRAARLKPKPALPHCTSSLFVILGCSCSFHPDHGPPFLTKHTAVKRNKSVSNPTTLQSTTLVFQKSRSHVFSAVFALSQKKRRRNSCVFAPRNNKRILHQEPLTRNKSKPGQAERYGHRDGGLPPPRPLGHERGGTALKGLPPPQEGKKQRKRRNSRMGRMRHTTTKHSV